MGRERGDEEFEGAMRPDQLTAVLMGELVDMVLAMPTEARAALTAFVHLADRRDRIAGTLEIGQAGELTLTLRQPVR